MQIGLLTLQIHLHAASCLKDKRRVVKSLLGRVRAKHNVAVARRRESLELMFDSIVTEAESHTEGDVIELEREYLG